MHAQVKVENEACKKGIRNRARRPIMCASVAMFIHAQTCLPCRMDCFRSLEQFALWKVRWVTF